MSTAAFTCKIPLFIASPGSSTINLRRYEDEKVLSLILIFYLMISQLCVIAGAVKFDDTTIQWAQMSIDCWSDHGVVDGIGEGEFDPDGNVTCA